MDIKGRLEAELYAVLSERNAQVAEIERLNDEMVLAHKVIDSLQAEIERLRTQCGGNCRYWEGRWRDEAAENERLTRRLYEVDAQLIAEDHIHARECMALRAEKDAEIERLRHSGAG